MWNGRSPRRQGGFTYVAMLVAVAVIGVGLAATGLVWSQSRQREKEQELLFVGDQIRQAIGRYYHGTPGPAKRYPQALEDLLADKRYPNPERYLRRIYTDPMTGKAEWGLMQAPEGGIMGVYSLSNGAPIKQAGFQDKDRTSQGATTYYEWRFFYEAPAAPGTQPPAAAASQAPANADAPTTALAAPGGPVQAAGAPPTAQPKTATTPTNPSRTPADTIGRRS